VVKLREWRADPVLFCWEVLGFHPWESTAVSCATQADILRSAAKDNRVAIRSGHKCGKSRICAALALWEFVCWPGSRTVITAPTHRQIENIIWRELTSLYKNARRPIGGVLHKTPGKGLEHPKHQTQVIGFSTNEADRVSGISGKRVTYIVDEASGVDPAIFTAIEGNRAAGKASRLVMISNPTQPTGTFYDAFHAKARFYTRHHISSRQVAHARAKGKGRFPKGPGLADIDWVKEKEDEWGFDSDDLRVRCDGDFAKSGAQSIVSAANYDAAVKRWSPGGARPWRKNRLEVAVDVAHFGDDTSAIVGRRGHYVYRPEGHNQLDGPQLALKVWNYVQSLTEHTDHSAVTKKPRVRVELVGVGASCFDTLRHDYSRWLDVVAYIPSASAEDPEKHINLRAEVWFNARDRISVSPYEIPEHPRMRDETLAVHYLYDKTNRYQAESKKNIKKRLKVSPDFGDAFVMCLWDPPQGFGRTVRIPGL